MGMIRGEREREGLAENTVIIVTSEHGYNSGSFCFGDIFAISSYLDPMVSMEKSRFRC